MALPTVSAVRIEVGGTLAGGDQWRNIYHADFPGTFDQGWADDVADDIVAAYNALSAFLHPDTRIDHITINNLSATPNPVLFAAVTPAAVGVSTSDALPPNLALPVSWKTATAGRSGHGRTFLPGWAENANTAEGGPSSAVLTAVGDYIDAMLGSTNFDLAIVSYYTGHTYGGSTGHKTIPTPRVTPDIHAVVSGKAPTKFGTMRSRSNGR